jgi:hypothetical protein
MSRCRYSFKFTLKIKLPKSIRKSKEELAVRIKDLDLDAKPAKVLERGECTKIRTDRTAFLTNEMA